MTHSIPAFTRRGHSRGNFTGRALPKLACTTSLR
jgi:hypothetical protein